MFGLLIITYLTVIITWFILFLIYFGFGTLIIRSVDIKLFNFEQILIAFWIGWSASITILQVWHLFFKIDFKPIILISILGILGLIWNYKDIYSIIKIRIKKYWPFIIILFLAAYWLSTKAILPPLNSDSGYHLSSINWAKTYPIIPGLGNLKNTLALNNSFFLQLASIDFGYLNQKSYHIGNGLLVIILITQIFFYIYKLFRKGNHLKLHHIFLIFFLPPLLSYNWIFNVSSASPDLPIIILGSILAVQLFSFLEDFTKFDLKENSLKILSITTISVIGITIKLNFIGLVIPIIIIIISLLIINRKNINLFLNKKTILTVIIIFFSTLILWIVRNVILSGYIVYPFPFFSFPVKWKIPKDSVIEIYNAIKGWARSPGPNCLNSIDNWNWINPWIKIHIIKFEVYMSFFVLLLGMIILFFSIFMKKITKNKKNKLPWLIIIPPIFFVIYWFFTAPDFRFAGSSFWILGAGVMTLALSNFTNFKKASKIIILFFCIILIFNMLWNLSPLGKKDFLETLILEKNINKAYSKLNWERTKLVWEDWKFLIRKNWWIYFPIEGEKDFVKILVNDKNIKKAISNLNWTKGSFQSFKYSDFTTYTTKSGLEIFIPEDGQCFYYPLPCAPVPPAYDIKLIDGKSIRSGFMVDND